MPDVLNLAEMLEAASFLSNDYNNSDGMGKKSNIKAKI